MIFSFNRFPKLSLENKQERGTSWIPHRVEQAENLTRGGGLSLAAEGCSEAMEATHHVRPIRIGGSRRVALTVMGDAHCDFHVTANRLLVRHHLPVREAERHDS